MRVEIAARRQGKTVATELERLHKDFALLVVGPGYDRPRDAHKALERACAYGGVAHRAIFDGRKHLAVVVLEPTQHGWAERYRGLGVTVLGRRRADAPNPW